MGLAGSASAAFVVEPGGVVLDTISGLEWEQNANHGPFLWQPASDYANTLTLDGGGWHLPTNVELRVLYDHLFATGLCSRENCTGSIGGLPNATYDAMLDDIMSMLNSTT